MNTYKNIDEYIANYPENVQKILQQLRKVILKGAPTATETISYGIPTYNVNGPLVHFAAYPKHIGFYPAPSVINAFRTVLKSYKISKGTVQFPIDKPLPLDLIKKIVQFRVTENNDK